MHFLADREGEGPPQVDSRPNDDKPPSIDYKPPTHLYSFPPNTDSLYPPPGDTRKPISVSSYLPPASGATNYPIYPGPLMPTASSLHTQVDNSGSVDGMTDTGMDGDGDGGSSMDDGGSNMDSGDPDRPSDDMKLIDKPPPNFVPNKNPEYPFLNDDHSHVHDHSHDHSHDHPPNFDHHHHDDHFHDAPFYDDSLKHLHGFEAFPGNSHDLEIRFVSINQNELPIERNIIQK